MTIVNNDAFIARNRYFKHTIKVHTARIKYEMEERERNRQKSCELQQTDPSSAKSGSGKFSGNEGEMELEESTEGNVREKLQVSPNSASVENSCTGPLQTEKVGILDTDGQKLQCEHMLIRQSENGQLYVIPSTHLKGTQVLLPSGQLLDNTESSGEPSQEDQPTLTLNAIDSSTNTLTTVAPQSFTTAKSHTRSSPDVLVPPLKALPAGAPDWAKRLRSCEKIGDSYRGYCNTEAELEAVLLLHKQQTHSVFGTRQSPSPAKPASRLMWKSQYVPYDGIPFVNAGSRAIVMECQFGPRRKGGQPKKGTTLSQEVNQNVSYKATCPARIYIKKVRKFPEYRVPVDPKVDKKFVRQEQEKAFFNLKKKLWDTGGVLRYYIQLPTQKAHLYHDVDPELLPPLPDHPDLVEAEMEDEEQEEMKAEEEEWEESLEVEDGCPTPPSRLHPLVAEKICELVAHGFNQVYTIRKQLRKFVEQEMFKSDSVPERHNLCYFPTINDIKNHIHEAQKTLQIGDRALASPCREWKSEGKNLLTETVTLTLTPAAINVNSQNEGHLEGSDTLSPEAVQLFSSLSSLQPKIFAQLQLQSATCPAEGPLVQPVLLAAEPLVPSSPSHTHTLLLSTSPFLQPSPTDREPVALPEPPSFQGMSPLVSVSTVEAEGTEGGMTQIVLEDGKTIPVQIVDPSSIVLNSSVEDVV